MKLYVPEIGDRLRLTQDWTFKLYNERRNATLRTHFGLTFSTDVDDVTIPSGTVLKVDRIYIRKGADDYSSISFYAEGIGSGSGAFGRPKSARFWAKLEDCNRIEFEIEELKVDSPKPKKVRISYDYSMKTEDADYFGVYYTDDRKGENRLFTIKGIKERVEYNNRNIFGQKAFYMATRGYELQTIEGELIKSYKSFESLKTYLRNWTKKQVNTDLPE